MYVILFAYIIFYFILFTLFILFILFYVIYFILFYFILFYFIVLFAAKAMGHEIKGANSYFRCAIPGLHLALQALIDYKGKMVTLF